MLLFGGVCRRRRAAAARLLPPTFGDTPALLIGCCCCHHDFKLRPPMLCFTVALASLFHAHCLCHYVAEVDGQGVTTGLACSAVGHFFDDAWCTEINVTLVGCVGYGERGAFGAGWDGEEKGSKPSFCSLQWGGWAGGRRLRGKDTKDGGIKYRNPSHFGTEGWGE
jgi:hypothetical protein